MREGVEEGKGRAYAEHGEEERALQAEEGRQKADNDGAQDEARVAANGKEAHARALAVPGEVVGIAGRLGMEEGASHAAQAGADPDAPV